MEIRSLSGYLFEYGLNKIFGGNKRAYARRLGIKNAEVYRYLDRYREGGGSAVAMEALLRLFVEEDVSMDKILETYKSSAQQSIAACACQEEIEKFRQETYQLKTTMKASEDYHLMMIHISRAMNRLAGMTCGGKPGERESCQWSGDEDACPCKQLVQTIAEIRERLERSSSA